jgi:hypothetical protein
MFQVSSVVPKSTTSEWLRQKLMVGKRNHPQICSILWGILASCPELAQNVQRIPRLFGRVPKRSIACGAQSPVTVHDDFFRFIATYFMGVIMYCPTLAEFRSKYQSPFLFKGWVWDLMHCCFCWLGINPKNCQVSQVASQWMDSMVKCNHGILKFGVDHQMGVTAKMHHPRWD